MVKFTNLEFASPKTDKKNKKTANVKQSIEEEFDERGIITYQSMERVFTACLHNSQNLFLY